MDTTWTEEQRKVIDLRDRNILVSAAAGSGKTAVLVERIISMVTDRAHPVDIDELLVVTFTKAAASEMRERIRRSLEAKRAEDPTDDRLEEQIALLGNAQITTIDSFCLYVIRNHFNEIDLDPSFRVADEMELTLMRSDILGKLLEDMYEAGSEEFLSFAACYARGKTDSGIEDLVMRLYNYSQSYPWPEEWLDGCAASLNPESLDAFESSGMMAFLRDYVHDIACDLRDQLLYAVDVCRLPDGPTFYEEALQSDLEQMEALIGAEDFDAQKRILDGLAWETLSRKRSAASAKNKDIVKAVRKDVKDTAAAIRKKFFFTDVAHMMADVRMTAGPMAVLIDLVKQFSQRFQAFKSEKNVVDFSDLEHFALNILIRKDAQGCQVKSAAAEELSRQYREILCDEYQDSNLLQETIFRAISREDEGHPNIFMVGDVKQSIYKFRLARPELFMEKYNDYSTEDGLYQRIDLHKNFRSRACVIDFVNLIFEHIMGKSLGGIDYDERAALYAGAVFPEQDALGTDAPAGDANTEVLLIDLSDDGIDDGGGDAAGHPADDQESVTGREAEAREVASRIRQLIAQQYQVLDKENGTYRPVQYRDIVVLLRTMRGWSEVFADVLTKSGIPAHAEVSGGFFDTYEIRTAVCLLSVIDNPIQDIELAAVLKSFVGGFSNEELAMIRSVQKRGSLYDACIGFLDPAADAFLDGYFARGKYLDVRRRLTDFLDMIGRFRVKASYMNIHQLIMEIFEETGYDRLISAMPYGGRRHANLELFIEKAVDYERTSYKGLFNFIRYIRNLRMQNTDIGEVSAFGEDENAVRIVSIHKSKGLEYPVVFVSGMNKSFNKQDARSSVLIHAEFGLGPEAVDEKTRVTSPTIFKKAMAEKIILESLSEELRVLYVALTRAKEKLILTASVRNFEKSEIKWLRSAGTGGQRLTFKDLISASGFLDWIMPVLYSDAYRAASEAEVDVRVIPYRNLAWRQAEDVVGNATRRGELLAEIERHEQTFDATYLDARFGWVYPKAAVIGLPAKLTVSEIKRLYQRQAEGDGDGAQMLYVPERPRVGEDNAKMLHDTSRPRTGAGVSAAAESDLTARSRVEETGVRAAAESDLTARSRDRKSENRFESSESSGAAADQAEPVAKGKVSAADRAARMRLAARRGSAMHKILELADFSEFRRLDDVRRFIDSCVQAGTVAKSLASEINPWQIYQFVRGPLGQRMIRAGVQRLHREQRFIMAVSAGDIFTDAGEMPAGANRVDAEEMLAGVKRTDVGEMPAGTEDTILIQGIIDAYFEEDDGIVLVDYKTDHVLSGQEEALVRRYAVQLDYYQEAIERATHQKVKERYIYSFSLGKEILA